MLISCYDAINYSHVPGSTELPAIILYQNHIFQHLIVQTLKATYLNSPYYRYEMYRLGPPAGIKAATSQNAILFFFFLIFLARLAL